MNTTNQPIPVSHPAPPGLRCPKCQATEFTTTWQTFSNGTRHVRADCAHSGAYVRYLPRGGDGTPAYKLELRPPDASAISMAPPAPDAEWIGWVRPADGKWRPVALAQTLSRAWEALLHFPGDVDRLAIPVLPDKDSQDSGTVRPTDQE
jgi:hypothetical protein